MLIEIRDILNNKLCRPQSEEMPDLDEAALMFPVLTMGQFEALNEKLKTQKIKSSVVSYWKTFD